MYVFKYVCIMYAFLYVLLGKVRMYAFRLYVCMYVGMWSFEYVLIRGLCVYVVRMC